MVMMRVMDVIEKAQWRSLAPSPDHTLAARHVAGAIAGLGGYMGWLMG
jgi:hypothetical protein